MIKKRSLLNLTQDEMKNLSKEIKGDNARVVGMGTYSVPKEIMEKVKRRKSQTLEEAKDKLYKDWVRYSAGVKTGDNKPLDSKEVFELHYDTFLNFVKQKELVDREVKFKEFVKDTKGKTGREAIVALSGSLRWAVTQSPKITAGQLVTLLSVALNEGQILSYYVEKTRQVKSTVSRHMLEMGASTEKYEGLEWIEMRDHTTEIKAKTIDKRAREFYLTLKGHQFIAHIEEQLSMPFEEKNMLSSILGIPLPTSGGGFTASAKATVITKADREREAALVQKKAEAAKKYKFLNK